MEKKYKNIIFDFGGVLVNFNVKEILQNLFKDENVMPLEDWYELFRCEALENLQRGTISGLQAMNQLPEKYNKDQVVKFFIHLTKNLSPIDKVINLVHLLKEKKYNMYLLSNTADGILESSGHDYSFLKLFDGVMLSHEVGAVKPYAKIYNILLEKYSLNPEECLFIDDFEWNVAGAKAVGIDGIVCTGSDAMISELATFGVLSEEEKAIL